jgi:stearoyl-CoA desaturase (delta-9 desaturase)
MHHAFADAEKDPHSPKYDHNPILMMGEAYHNNHHKFGGRPNFGGVRWYEIDMTYVIMVMLEKFGVIHMNRAMSQVQREV